MISIPLKILKFVVLPKMFSKKKSIKVHLTINIRNDDKMMLFYSSWSFKKRFYNRETIAALNYEIRQISFIPIFQIIRFKDPSHSR